MLVSKYSHVVKFCILRGVWLFN